MFANIDIDPNILAHAAAKTVVITGAAGGIGAATTFLFAQHGANVVMADLPEACHAAEALINTLAHPDRAIFVPTDILNWTDMQQLFAQAETHFGAVDIVVADAGAPVLDMDAVDGNGKLLESPEAFRVLDVNVKTRSARCVWVRCVSGILGSVVRCWRRGDAE